LTRKFQNDIHFELCFSTQIRNVHQCSTLSPVRFFKKFNFF